MGSGGTDSGNRSLRRAHDAWRMPPGRAAGAKLDDDYLLWYDVPVGPKQTHPDFVVIHARRDSAQNIYGRHRTRGFSFKSVGIQESGRTTILRIKYRNTKQIL
jgi:hypothetical protein